MKNKSSLIIALLILTFANSAQSEEALTIEKFIQTWQKSVPNKWQKLDDKTLNKFSFEIANYIEKKPIKFKYGFLYKGKYQPNLHPPYILIHFQPKPHIPIFKLRRYINKDKGNLPTKRVRNTAINTLKPSIIKSIDYDEIIYEPQRKVLIIKNSIKTDDEQSLDAISAKFLYNGGYLEVNCYCHSAYSKEIFPEFQAILATIDLNDTPLAYHPSFSDNMPISVGNALFLVGILAIYLSIRGLSRRKSGSCKFPGLPADIEAIKKINEQL